MASEVAKRDANNVPVIMGVTDDSSLELRMLRADPTTKRLKVSAIVATGVVGPGSSTDNAVVRWDGTSGNNIQNSTITLSDVGVFAPTANDGGTLGAGTLAFSDLFLASGAVVNFQNGNLTLTHSPGFLTLAGGLRTTAGSVGINKSNSATIALEIKSDSTFTQGARVEADISTRLGLSTFVTGDAQVRFTFRTDGLIGWGDGTNPTDTDLFRSAANTLKTSSALIVTGSLTPATNDGSALGSSTVSWADLFLASGAVLNFSNGNTVLTHSSGILTVSTGDFRVTTAGTNIASVVTVGGTQTLTAKTLTTPAITSPDVSTSITTPSSTFSLVNSTATTVSFAGDATTISIGTSTALVTIPGNIINTSNAITASGNAATVPITRRISTVTNNSAATLTITITTTSAVDGQMLMIRVLDASASAQTISWVNTENSNVSVPTTTNGSTTLPLTVGFQFNALTSKWRCIASA